MGEIQIQVTTYAIRCELCKATSEAAQTRSEAREKAVNAGWETKALYDGHSLGWICQRCAVEQRDLENRELRERGVV